MVALGVLLLLAVGLYAARGPLFEHFVVERLQASLTSRFGGQVRIESVSGNWFDGVELHGITLQGGGVWREVVAGEARLDLGLLQLWRGQWDQLEHLHLNAQRALVVLPELPAGADPVWQQAAVQALRDSLAGGLPGELAIEVADLEVRGREGKSVRGPLRATAMAPAATAELAVDATLSDLQLRLRGKPDGSVQLQVSSPRAGPLAELLLAVPAGSVGAVDLQIALASTSSASSSSDAIAVSGTVSELQLGAMPLRDLKGNGSFAAGALSIASLTAYTAAAQVTLRDYHAPLADLWSGAGEVAIAASDLKPLLESPLLGFAAIQSWQQVAPLLDNLQGDLVFDLRDQALHVRPTTLTTPVATLFVTDALLPLRVAQWDAVRVALRAELPATEDEQRLVTAGTVSLVCSRQGGAFELQADAELSLRDAQGRDGQLSGRCSVSVTDALHLRPDCVVRGAVLQGLPALHVTGSLRSASLRSDETWQLQPLLLQTSDAGSIELRGSVQSGDWLADRDLLAALLASSLQAELRDLQLAAWSLPMVSSAALPPLWQQSLDAKLDGALQFGASKSADLQLRWSDLPFVGEAAAKVAITADDVGLSLQDGELTTAIGTVQFQVAMPELALRNVLREPAAILQTSVQANAQFRSKALQDLVALSVLAGLRGTLAMDGQLQGTLSQPVVDLRFLANDAELQVAAMRLAQPVGSVHIENGVCRLLDIALSVDQATVQIAGELREDADAVRGDLTANVARLPAGYPDTEARVQFRLDAQRLAVAELHLHTSMLNVAVNEVEVAAGLDVWLAAIASGDAAAVMAAAVRGALQLTVADVSLLPGLAGQGLAGRVVLEGRVSGTLGEPDPELTMVVSGGSVRIPEGPRLDDVAARLVASSSQIDCQQMSATVAGGSIQMHGTLRGNGPWWRIWQDGELNLKIDGKDVLLRRRNGVKLRSDLDLTATGPWSHIDLKGSLATQASKVVGRLPYFTLGNVAGADAARGFELSGFDLGEHLAVYLDLAVTSAQPIEIDTNVVTGEVTSALQLHGTLRAPRIEGTLAMPNGTITFPGCAFRTSNALLRFSREDPAFPRLSLTAVGRRHGYDVRMVVRGPYHAPEIQLSSTPPLPAEQLAVLVTTGARPDSLRGSRAVGALLGSYLVQELADYLFGSESTEAKEGFVSRFEVETGTEISANGTESIVVNFRVVDRVFLQGERDVYEDVNLGIVYRIRFQ